MKPVNINLHQKSRVLEIEYEDGSVFQLPCEYLRVYSPSAEVTGHGPGQTEQRDRGAGEPWKDPPVPPGGGARAFGPKLLDSTPCALRHGGLPLFPFAG